MIDSKRIFKSKATSGTVVITGEPGACSACAERIGEIYNNSAGTYDGFETFSKEKKGGLFHPNCRCGVLDYNGDKTDLERLSNDELLAYALDMFVTEYSANQPGNCSTCEVLDILREYDELIDEVSDKYGIDKALIQSVLFREIAYRKDIDELADKIVSETNAWHAAIDKYNQAPLSYQIIQMPPQKPYQMLNDSYTGLGRVSAKMATDAIDWYIKNIANIGYTDYTDRKANGSIWEKLKNDDAFNIDIVGLVLLHFASKLEADLKSKEDIIKVFNMYNRNNEKEKYGEEVYEYYKLFQTYNSLNERYVNGGHTAPRTGGGGQSSGNGVGRSKNEQETKNGDDAATLWLSEGSVGDDVRELQRMLNILGYTDDSGRSLTETGVFDQSTLEAVNAFKNIYFYEWNKDALEGVVGQTTWDFMLDLISQTSIDAIITPGSQVMSDNGLFYLGLLETHGSKYNVYDDEKNLIGIYSADIGDGGITYGFGHYVSYKDNEKQRILKEKYGLEFKEGVFVPTDICIEMKQDDVSNNKISNLVDLDNFINDNNIPLTQNQYDALVCMVFLRKLPQDIKSLILQKNIDDELYGDYEREFYDIMLNDFKTLSSFERYGAGWTNRIKNEMDVYFRNDYSKKY